MKELPPIVSLHPVSRRQQLLRSVKEKASARRWPEAKEKAPLEPREIFVSNGLSPRYQELRRKVKNHNRVVAGRREDPYYRDYEKIHRSPEFQKLAEKTQVFYFPSERPFPVADRQKHSFQVFQIASILGRKLGLNQNLLRAVALGHDLGHTPFGHDGERLLSEVSGESGAGEFHHNVHSLEVADSIAGFGRGLELSWEVRDGILFHDGETKNKILVLQPKSESDIEMYCRAAREGRKFNWKPATLEGCVVRLADQIAYLPQDFEDAIKMGIIKREDLPEDLARELGNNREEMVDKMIEAVVEHSRGHNYITPGPRAVELIDRFKAFNYENIYLQEGEKNQLPEIRAGFPRVYRRAVKDLQEGNSDSPVYREFLNQRPDYVLHAKPEEIARDFVASLTDRQFMNVLREAGSGPKPKPRKVGAEESRK